MSDETFSGVDTLLGRMKTHPEEFFSHNTAGKNRWDFMYKDYFRDSMTESEKGRIHEEIRKVRRMEFDAMVVKELMKDAISENEKEDAEETLKYNTANRYGVAVPRKPGGRI